MAVLVLSIGDDARDPFVISAKDYLKRANRLISPVFLAIPEGKRKSKGQTSKIELDEGAALLERSKNCLRIALDETGTQVDSLAFAQKLNRALSSGKTVAFLIGGASGLSEQVKQEADQIWSLSPLTLPHRLALLVLAEQIYRSGEIFKNSPYHK